MLWHRNHQLTQPRAERAKPSAAALSSGHRSKQLQGCPRKAEFAMLVRLHLSPLSEPLVARPPENIQPKPELAQGQEGGGHPEAAALGGGLPLQHGGLGGPAAPVPAQPQPGAECAAPQQPPRSCQLPPAAGPPGLGLGGATANMH